MFVGVWGSEGAFGRRYLLAFGVQRGRSVEGVVCCCVGFREGVRWKEMFLYCTGTELPGCNMAVQHNFNSLNCKGNKITYIFLLHARNASGRVEI